MFILHFTYVEVYNTYVSHTRSCEEAKTYNAKTKKTKENPTKIVTGQ
jgi:hypothetical protein